MHTGTETRVPGGTLHARMRNVQNRSDRLALRMVAKSGCYMWSHGQPRFVAVAPYPSTTQPTTVQALQQVFGPLMRHVDASNRTVADAVSQRGGGGQTGQRRRLENKGVLLPRLETKTLVEDWAYSFRDHIHVACRDASDMMKRIGEKVSHPGAMEERWKQFPRAEDLRGKVPQELFCHRQGEDHASNPPEANQRLRVSEPREPREVRCNRGEREDVRGA